MELVTLVIALALVEYIAFGILVGRARGQYGVAAPATSGHPTFDRYFRVHQNTMELLVAFVPATWLFALYLSTRWAAILGALYLLGRVLYLKSYVADPARRSLGFGLSILPILVMLVGVVVAAGLKALG
ncbi:MAG TPA: MAPEG family protein [Steroidobacteraceae bacterium]|nr:MAPEG family protein [Steroidobacteraceae bacterium]